MWSEFRAASSGNFDNSNLKLNDLLEVSLLSSKISELLSTEAVMSRLLKISLLDRTDPLQNRAESSLSDF